TGPRLTCRTSDPGIMPASMTALALHLPEMAVPIDSRRAPTRSELATLFLPFSAGRRMLHRCHQTLMRFEPGAPRYTLWHLARFVKTFEKLSPLMHSGTRWLDLSSDPWFC